MLWSYYLLSVRVVSIEAAELALGVPEQHQEVGAVAGVDLVHDPLPGVLVDHPGEDSVLKSIHHDGSVSFQLRLSEQPLTSAKTVPRPSGGLRGHIGGSVIIITAVATRKRAGPEIVCAGGFSSSRPS